jgi:hypothetical protein
MSRYRHGEAKEERINGSYSFLTSALGGGEWSASSPGRALPREWTPSTHLSCLLFLMVGWVLVPKRGCLLTLAYYAFPRWYEFGERRWNDILTRENRRTPRKTCPSATLSTTNPTWIDPGAKPGLRSERPATNDLSHGTAHLFRYWS